jgi:hypothetical protein
MTTTLQYLCAPSGKFPQGRYVYSVNFDFKSNQLCGSTPFGAMVHELNPITILLHL